MEKTNSGLPPLDKTVVQFFESIKKSSGFPKLVSMAKQDDALGGITRQFLHDHYRTKIIVGAGGKVFDPKAYAATLRQLEEEEAQKLPPLVVTQEDKDRIAVYLTSDQHKEFVRKARVKGEGKVKITVDGHTFMVAPEIARILNTKPSDLEV